MVGRTISHYRVFERLGEGGMGVVYLAEDLALKRRVALKFLPADATADPEAHARLTHEAQAAAALLHPNICPVYEIAEADGQTFIAMAYLEGRTLRERLAEGAVPLAEALAIARQVGEGLAAAHAKGVVHRDVKPGNVMLTPDGRAVLMDFGLARVGDATRLTRTGTTLGTVAYMAPEQACGEAADARSDVWALGVVVYELVSGRLPFRRAMEAAQLYAIVNAEPEPLTAVAVGVPAGLNGVVTKALAKEASRRYQHAGELAADLAALERDLTAEPAGRGRRTRRQRAWLAAAVAFGAVALVVAATALNVGGLRERLFEGGPRIRSIAVLPLANLSGDPEQEYFADGMTEALINDLGQVSALRVISRTSAMAYKETKKSLKQIARELNVDAIVEGSVQRSGERVKISAQLIRARDERQLWAAAPEREFRDVLTLQGELATTIAGAVKARLTPGERTRLAEARPVDPGAQEDFMRGRYFLSQWTESGFRTAIDYFEKALAGEPGMAAAYSGIAEAYQCLGAGGLGAIPPREGYEKSRAAALRALELDDNLSDAHMVLGVVYAEYDWEFAKAEHEYMRAVELNPSNGMAMMMYAQLLGYYHHEFEKALAMAKKAVAADPLTPFIRANLVWRYYAAGRLDEALVEAKGALAIEPNFWITRWVLGIMHMDRDALDEAIAELLRAVELSAGSPYPRATLGFALARNGRREETLAILRDFRRRADLGHIPAPCMVELYEGLGERDSAIVWAERAFSERSFGMLASMPPPTSKSEYAALWTDPRFRALLRRAGLPDTLTRGGDRG